MHAIAIFGDLLFITSRRNVNKQVDLEVKDPIRVQFRYDSSDRSNRSDATSLLLFKVVKPRKQIGWAISSNDERKISIQK